MSNCSREGATAWGTLPACPVGDEWGLQALTRVAWGSREASPEGGVWGQWGKSAKREQLGRQVETQVSSCK